ncbi:hypothetical protein [Aquibium sp. ELW1220]|jgi:hypothetical protein|uniref:hypothetical protein n=1 Tax=Aquibium sp. ELW1220 TaxID=2976766 RepID=UPI0025B04A74|nr:hypothetical protein [Aquibium sp. ELW1220]MDN2583926.1 hypothetical protein [Aquibium sp. ELW1220]
MYKTVLTEQDTNAGLLVVKALDAAGLPIAFAGWIKTDDSPAWLLHVASPDVQTFGPTAVIRLIGELAALLSIPIATDDITVANTTNSFLTRIDARDYDIEKDKHPFEVSARGRVLGYFDGKSIEDSFVYRVDRHVRASDKPVKVTKQVVEKAKKLAA